MFKWACLSVASLFGLVLVWMINDVRSDLQGITAAVQQNLPEILAKTKTSTETLAALSSDIRQLRDLSGATDQTRDRSLAAYADSVLDLLEETDAEIGVEKTFGSDLKDVLPAKEWVVAARKEGLWLAFRAKSRREVLERLTNTKFGSEWMIRPAGEKPQPLSEWLHEHHAETRQLSAEDTSPTAEDSAEQ
jgi:hypothetical protein